MAEEAKKLKTEIKYWKQRVSWWKSNWKTGR